MALPKHKISKSRGGMRRSHQKVDLPQLTKCPKCHEPKLPHTVCAKCGTYKGRTILRIEEEA
jgi:large subunit ribosomal protein L32